MDVIAVLPAFLAAVVLISASLGPAMALMLRRAALRGTRAAIPTVLGLEFGLYPCPILMRLALAIGYRTVAQPPPRSDFMDLRSRSCAHDEP